ncbi:MFS transporter [Nonomuraea spiralis]|uniref:MFS transporter n=1 Tax=Nonomuraea spiralis TaxID=46182 RepID=A0ABV5IA12_9ACTN|nr:MFS transporter [Nonomuraea spiralis]GGT05597.1 MFS transporter [Nonomuraea spiralis]
MLDVPNKTQSRGLAPTLVLALGTFAVGTDAFVVAGFLPDLAASLEVTEGAAGQSVTVFAAAYAVLSPVLATVAARVPRRALLVAALVVLGLANLGSALAPSFPVLIATRVLAAAGAAAYTPGAGAVAAALVRPELRARALAVVVGGLTVATALGVPLGDLAGERLGWRYALGAVAAACLAVAAGVYAIMPVLPGAPRVPLRTRLGVLRRPAVMAILPLTVLGMGASYTVYAYSVPALRAVGVEGTAGMLFLYGLGAVLGNLAAGYAADRWGAGRVLPAAYLVMAVSLGLLAWTAAGGAAIGGAAIGVLVLGWGASSWCQTPPQQHRLIAAAPREAPLVVSLNSSAIYAGIGAGTLLGGLTLPSGAAFTYGTGAALAVVALVFALVTRSAGGVAE